MELISALSSLVSSSNIFTTLGIFFTTFILLFDFMKRRKTWTRFPPGPTPLPLLGNMLQVDFRHLPASLTQLAKKYGNVYSLQFGWENVVVLNGYQVLKEMLVNKSEDIADRPRIPMYDYFGFGGKSEGVVMARYGRAWKEQRRFSLSNLRNFGLGKKSLEERVIGEAGFLCSAFIAKEGQPFDPHYIVNNAVSNVICSITFGDRFEYDDKKLQRFLRLFEESLELESGFLPQILNVVPWVMNLPGPHQKIVRTRNETFDILRGIVREHKESFDPAHKRDFIDAFLEEMEKEKEDPESSFNDGNILFTTIELFSAGTETTSTTLRWGLLYMVLHPGIQSKVHEEIDGVLGRGRRPTMEDQASMPFTTAVIHEIQRCGDIVPIAMPHMTYRNTEIHGFSIPKGTTVITNLSSALKDDTVWEKPHQFYPDHFLDEDGKFRKREEFMAFSAGRRVCLGEQLARMELFLFFTTLLQHFTFTIPSGQPTPREDPIFAFTQTPHPYQISAQLR